MLRIRINSIPHHEQRYETVGDYYGDPRDLLHVNVSEMKDCYMEFLVAFHEQIEFFLTHMRGISEESITKFDVEYEKNRPADDLTSEPGDDPRAPYHHEHVFATCMERLMCAELGIRWEDYEKVIYSL